MSKLRVCYIGRFTEGGSAISLTTLATNLDRTRFEPLVLFHRVRTPATVEALERAGVPVHDLAAPDGGAAGAAEAAGAGPSGGAVEADAGAAPGRSLRSRVPGYQLARALRDFVRRDRRLVAPLERFFRERKVDLIHLNNGLRYHRADLLVAGRLGIPAVCHVRAFQPLTPLERFLGRRVRRFIYISRAIGADYERQGIAPERGLVVHNVVSVPAAPGEEARAKLRAEFGWDRSHFIAVNVGRLVPWKGQDVFLRAVRAAAASLPRLRALVVGAADPNQKSRAYASGLEALAREAGLAGRVVFAGHRADVPALFAAADVAVHSATKPEPFGRVIIEAMAAGTAVVAAEDGGVAEIVAPETDGVLVPPGDAEALARALLGLAGDDARRRRLAAAGKARVERHFSVENQVRQIEQAYEACVAR